MTEKNLLGKDGLTVTSANHLANIAKEMYEAIEAKLASLTFYNRDYMLAINNNTFRVENESGKDELGTIDAKLKEVGELKSLIAYLREGIKAKQELDTDAAFDAYVEKLIEEGREDLARPKEKCASAMSLKSLPPSRRQGITPWRPSAVRLAHTYTPRGRLRPRGSCILSI